MDVWGNKGPMGQILPSNKQKMGRSFQINSLSFLLHVLYNQANSYVRKYFNLKNSFHQHGYISSSTTWLYIGKQQMIT